MYRLALLGLGSLLLTLVACHGDSTSAPPSTALLVVAAGVETVEPSALALEVQVDQVSRLGLARVDRHYRVTTPAGEPFSFDVMTRAASNSGSVSVSIGHVADGGVTPIGDAVTLARAGCVPIAAGIIGRGEWLDAWGDGFARITLAGSIVRNQILAVATVSPAGRSTALVQIEIGPTSSINRVADTGGNHPGVVAEKTLYSSDSWVFRLPTVAVSGDRTSVVVYEGDRADWQRPDRYELRLQYDHRTDQVTGGGASEANPDTGNWRDHEIAALYNVLALANCGRDALTVQLSFDRGATMGQAVTIPSATESARLVQIAMAEDYSLAVFYWTSRGIGAGSELMLLEGRPAAYDSNKSPTQFSFDAPALVHRSEFDATPMLTGAAWSAGGDLVVGYAFTRFAMDTRFQTTNTSEFWCAVRPWGEKFTAHKVDEARLIGFDPSVALLGSGEELQIFYVYEGLQGVMLRRSDDAGATYSSAALVGTRGAHTPTVFARQRQSGEVQVDLLYLVNAGAGTELHAARWLDFDTSARVNYQLTRSVMHPTKGGGNAKTGPIDFGHRLTQIAWLGYDAVLDGDEIVVVYDEETFDAGFMFLGAWNSGANTTGGRFSLPPLFNPAKPPPLAPGMTQPVQAPDPTHRHQLKLLRLK